MPIVLNFGALSIATTYSLTGPASGFVGIDTADFSVTPNGPYVGTITVRVSSNSYPVGISPIVLSWNGTFETQAFFFVAPFAGIYALDATNSDALIDASELLCTISSAYFVSPTGSGGNGSITNPWGPAELVSGGSPGVAFTTLQPGDTLYFRAGDYHFTGITGNNNPMMSPSHVGTATQPITIRAYPGETVNIIEDSATAGQPFFGGYGYTRFFGFTLSPQKHQAIFLNGTGNEVAYNEAIGVDSAQSNNYEGIRLDYAMSNWVHHNIVRGFQGTDSNCCGIKVYKNRDLLCEDNYLYGNVGGIFDKDAGNVGFVPDGNHDTFRRNYSSGNTTTQLIGNNQGVQATYYICDNVIGGPIDIQWYGTKSEIHNNLMLLTSASLYNGKWVALTARTVCGDVNAWNNIGIGSGNPLWGYLSHDLTLTSSPPALDYFDYNVWDASPTYSFDFDTGGRIDYTLAQFQTAGYEANSAVDTLANIFVDQIAYAVKSPYTSNGRYGDTMGPITPVATILDTTRYGPGGLTGTAPTITVQPANQTAAAGGTATFEITVSDSGWFYQWQRSNDGGNSWVNDRTASGTTSSLSVVVPATSVRDNAAQFRCLISGQGGSAWSIPATLAVTGGVSSAASYIGSDTTTQGTWVGVYGADGYVVIGDTTGNAAGPSLGWSPPAYAEIRMTGQSEQRIANPTSDIRGLQETGGATRVAAAMSCGTMPMNLDMALTDGASHPIRLYCCDWNAAGISQRIDVLDGNTGATLDSRTLSSFSGGQYLEWNITGHVRFRFTTLSQYSLLQGIFFD